MGPPHELGSCNPESVPMSLQWRGGGGEGRRQDPEVILWQQRREEHCSINSSREKKRQQEELGMGRVERRRSLNPNALSVRFISYRPLGGKGAGSD